MKRAVLPWVVIALMNPSCAFKESQKATEHAPVASPQEEQRETPIIPVEKPAPSPSAQPLPSPSPAPSPSPSPSPTPKVYQGQLTLKVMDSKRGHQEYIRESQAIGTAPFKVDFPLVIPASAPNEVEMSILSDRFKTGSVQRASAKAYVGRETSASKALEVRITSSEKDDTRGNLTRLTLSGLNQFLSPAEEGAITLLLELTGAEENPPVTETWRFILATPPSRITHRQVRVQDYETEGGLLPTGVRTLTSLGMKLSLLQVISVKSQSAWSVALQAPVRLPGKLTTHYKQVTVSQSFCSHTVSAREWDEDLSSELYLIPITDDLYKKLSSLINDALGSGGWDVLISPGETRLLGIYAAGDRAADLMSRGHPTYRLAPVQAITGCRSRCGDPRRDMYHWDASKTAMTYWSQRGWPGHSKTCEDLRNSARIFPERPHPNEAAMNLCAEWELTNGTQPWDSNRFCQSPGPGNPWNYPAKEMWMVEKSTATVMEGTESAPVLLKIAAESLQMNAQYPNFGPENISLARAISGIGLPETKQAD